MYYISRCNTILYYQNIEGTASKLTRDDRPPIYIMGFRAACDVGIDVSSVVILNKDRNRTTLTFTSSSTRRLRLKDWDTTIMNTAAPGELLRETKRSASYLVRGPLDLEGKRR